MLEELFGHKENATPTLTPVESILPERVLTIVQKGALPTLNIDSLLLEKNEVCRFVDKAYFIQEKVIRHTRSKYGGMSFRVMKGMTYHVGGADAKPIEEKQYKYIPGYFYVTDRRLIFVSKEQGLDERLKNVTAVLSYTNAVGLQTKSKTLNFILPRPEVAVQIIKMIRRS